MTPPMTPPTRRAPTHLDPDPLYVAPPERVRPSPVRQLERDEDDGGATLGVVVLALAAVVIGCAIGVWLARSVAAPRPAQSTTALTARDVSGLVGGTSSGLTGAPRDDWAVSRRPAAPLPDTATELAGWATWYDVRTGNAAAGPAVRRALGPSWRGQRIRVCAGGHCITTALTDWCACGSRHGIPTLVDLARADFARLGSPSAGVLLVTVTRAGSGRPVRLPATDTIR